MYSGQTILIKDAGWQEFGGEWVYGFVYGSVNAHGYIQNGWFCAARASKVEFLSTLFVLAAWSTNPGWAGERGPGQVGLSSVDFVAQGPTKSTMGVDCRVRCRYGTKVDTR